MAFHQKSNCKINLLLNTIGRASDGFHQLETLFYPIPLHDELSFDVQSEGIELSCNDSRLPVDSKNLVWRAADLFFRKSEIKTGIRIHLEKQIPMEAGLGGGSGNAASTLMALNNILGMPLTKTDLKSLAATLGSDVPFFLQSQPAVGTGRGEIISPVGPIPSMQGMWIILVHPGFGISTPWAYKRLYQFPEIQNGKAGRVTKLLDLLRENRMTEAAGEVYNSLETPVLEKYPLLVLFQRFFRSLGCWTTLMSGSGSTTFAIFQEEKTAREALEKFEGKFGSKFWIRSLPLS